MIRTLKHDGIFRALSPDGKTLATVSDQDGFLWLWNTATGEWKRTEITGSWGHLPTNAVFCATFSSDGMILATSGIDTRVALWDAATLKKLGELTGLDKPPSALRFSPDNKLLAAPSWGGVVRVWGVATHRCIRSFQAGSNGARVAFSPDGRLLAVGRSDGIVTLLNIATGHKRSEFKLDKDAAVASSAVCFSPSGECLATGYGNGLVALWDIASGKQLRTYSKHTSAISNIVFLPGADTMITSDSSNGIIAVWDVSNVKQVDRQ